PPICIKIKSRSYERLYQYDIYLKILQLNYCIFSINASPNSEHFTSVAPSIRRAKSYVTTFLDIVFSIAWLTRSAASCHPKCSSINTPESSTDEGFTLSCPAYLGAVPCVASKIACPVS